MTDETQSDAVEPKAEDVDPTQELEAMTAMSKVLGGLSEEQRARALLWANRFYGAEVPESKYPKRRESKSTNDSEEADVPVFDSFDVLFDAVDPQDNAMRALTAGYWFQVVKGQDGFDGYTVNSKLKEHGEDVSNVTNAFTSLINRKPRLAIQSGKLGKLKKAYKLTTEGVKTIRRMVSGGHGETD